MRCRSNVTAVKEVADARDAQKESLFASETNTRQTRLSCQQPFFNICRSWSPADSRSLPASALKKPVKMPNMDKVFDRAAAGDTNELHRTAVRKRTVGQADSRRHQEGNESPFGQALNYRADYRSKFSADGPRWYSAPGSTKMKSRRTRHDGWKVGTSRGIVQHRKWKNR